MRGYRDTHLILAALESSNLNSVCFQPSAHGDQKGFRFQPRWQAESQFGVRNLSSVRIFSKDPLAGIPYLFVNEWIINGFLNLLSAGIEIRFILVYMTLYPFCISI